MYILIVVVVEPVEMWINPSMKALPATGRCVFSGQDNIWVIEQSKLSPDTG
jgi:hypothetical protein